MSIPINQNGIKIEGSLSSAKISRQGVTVFWEEVDQSVVVRFIITVSLRSLQHIHNRHVKQNLFIAMRIQRLFLIPEPDFSNQSGRADVLQKRVKTV